MKKILLITAFVTFGLLYTNAQDIKFGAKAGVNFATFAGDVEDVDARTSFHIGAVAEFVISEKFSVQPELLYSGQGARRDITESFFGQTIKLENTVNLSYFNLPILAKYYVSKGFSLEAGPQIGFLIGGEEELKVSEGGESESESIDASDLYKRIDFGLGLGTSYRLDSGLNFSARYNVGLADINDFEDSIVDINNNVFQLSIGYFFN